MTDLVAPLVPMVYAQTRRAPNAADKRGQFVELMGAAYRFDPQRTCQSVGPVRMDDAPSQ